MSTGDTSALKGELVVFHAGSLSVPFREIASAFNQEYPDVRILMEPAGSVASARKITDLNRMCDIIAVSDYQVIDELLIPDHATWNLTFATNEMVIAFHEKSARSDRIDSLNWHTVLSDRDVRYGRSDPDQDPCGYRTIQTILLAEKLYRIPSLSQSLLTKDQTFIRPKEVDLLALLETRTVDYIFIYRSVALQHQLKFILLPDGINLKDPQRADLYRSVSVEIKGREPGQTITMHGEPMLYSVSIPTGSPHPEAAMAFVRFLLSEKGQRIMGENGQPPVVPAVSGSYDEIPGELKRFATP